MVKGISRQVIVVHSREPALFEQAIFILNDRVVGSEGVTEAQLLQEAGCLVGDQKKRTKGYLRDAVWACTGAIVTAALFLISGLF